MRLTMVLCYCAERSLRIGTTDTNPRNVSTNTKLSFSIQKSDNQ